MSLTANRKPAGRHARRGGAGAVAGPQAKTPMDATTIRTDAIASLVVFLVALPLCIGIAGASGVPVSLGILTGVVGGVIVGFLPGSTLQVSGPAAGLAVLVLEFTTKHGVDMLGVVVLAAGVIQMGLGVARMGRMFQSIPVSVVQGMLAGIGLPLLLSQAYTLMDDKQLGSALANLTGLPSHLAKALGDPAMSAALILGLLSVAICVLWSKIPGPVGKLPPALVAVLVCTAIAAFPGFDVKRVTVSSLFDAISLPGPKQFAGLLDAEILTMVVTFAVIASAESLFSASAVDRMHTGPRTKFNMEIFAQGVGNTICGILGALPMTAVIARSSVNVFAGAKTKISRIMHGVWLLIFVLLLPGVIGLVPLTALAGILAHTGWKLFNPTAFPKMWRTDRSEGISMILTTLVIFLTNLLEGVLAGLALAIVLVALRMSQMKVSHSLHGDTARLKMSGNAMFLRLPHLSDSLDVVAGKRRVEVDLTGLTHMDLTCKGKVEEWAAQQRKAGTEHVELRLPDGETEPTAAEDKDASGDGQDTETLPLPDQAPEPEREPAAAGPVRGRGHGRSRAREGATVPIPGQRRPDHGRQPVPTPQYADHGYGEYGGYSEHGYGDPGHEGGYAGYAYGDFIDESRGHGNGHGHGNGGNGHGNGHGGHGHGNGGHGHGSGVGHGGHGNGGAHGHGHAPEPGYWSPEAEAAAQAYWEGSPR